MNQLFKQKNRLKQLVGLLDDTNLKIKLSG